MRAPTKPQHRPSTAPCTAPCTAPAPPPALPPALPPPRSPAGGECPIPAAPPRRRAAVLTRRPRGTPPRRSGTRRARSASRAWASPSTAAPTAACSSSMSTSLRPLRTSTRARRPSQQPTTAAHGPHLRLRLRRSSAPWTAPLGRARSCPGGVASPPRGAASGVWRARAEAGAGLEGEGEAGAASACARGPTCLLLSTTYYLLLCVDYYVPLTTRNSQLTTTRLQVEGRVPHPGGAARPRQLPLCGAWQQDRPRLACRFSEEVARLVPGTTS